MGNPLAEILVRQVVRLRGRFLGANVDMDSQRAMREGEVCYLTDTEIVQHLRHAGFRSISKEYFWTQRFLNHMFVGHNKKKPS